MNKKVKKDIISRVYNECSLNGIKEITFSKKNLNIIFESFLDVLSDEIMSDNVIELRGFGTFSKKKNTRTEFFNPKTREKIIMENRFKILFKPSSKFFKNQ